MNINEVFFASMFNKNTGGNMITLIKTGSYKLIETAANIKILYLDNQPHAWVTAESIGQILVWSQVPHKTNRALAMGAYQLYDVDDEPYLTDLQHLELEFGKNAWQGYLLPTGLPDKNDTRTRFIPTTEIITGNSRFTSEMGFERWGKAPKKKALKQPK